MGKQPNIIYEPHPVSDARKSELRAQGFQIVDAIYAPGGGDVPHSEHETSGDNLSVSKSSSGRHYVKNCDGGIVCGPFATRGDADAAKEREKKISRMSVKQGARGRWFVMQGATELTRGFHTKEEARAAMADMEGEDDGANS